MKKHKIILIYLFVCLPVFLFVINKCYEKQQMIPIYTYFNGYVNYICHLGKPDRAVNGCQNGEQNIIHISNAETNCSEEQNGSCQSVSYEGLSAVVAKEHTNVQKGTLLGYIKKKDLDKFKFIIYTGIDFD